MIKPIIKNKGGKNGSFMMFMGILVSIAVIIGVVALVWFVFQQPTETEIRDRIITTTTLAPGRPGTLSLRALDKGNDDTQVAAQAYVVLNPTIGDNEITGSFAANAILLSATAGTDVTDGISEKVIYTALAGNGSTHFGFPGQFTSQGEAVVGSMSPVKTQSDLVILDTYTTTTAITITMKGDDGLAILNSTRNLTLIANDKEVLEEIKIKQTTANQALNVWGIYFDKAIGANVTDISLVDGASGLGPNGETPALKQGGVTLESTEADDWSSYIVNKKILKGIIDKQLLVMLVTKFNWYKVW